MASWWGSQTRRLLYPRCGSIGLSCPRGAPTPQRRHLSPPPPPPPQVVTAMHRGWGQSQAGPPPHGLSSHPEGGARNAHQTRGDWHHGRSPTGGFRDDVRGLSKPLEWLPTAPTHRSVESIGMQVPLDPVSQTLPVHRAQTPWGRPRLARALQSWGGDGGWSAGTGVWIGLVWATHFALNEVFDQVLEGRRR